MKTDVLYVEVLTEVPGTVVFWGYFCSAINSYYYYVVLQTTEAGYVQLLILIATSHFPFG